MNLDHILILASMQGISEFLPISSSAHLALTPYFANWADQGLLFDIALHFGTLLAVMLFCRKEISDILVGFCGAVGLGPGHKEGLRLGGWLIMATIPLVIIGAIGFEFVATHGRSLVVIGATSIIFGLLLGLADWAGPNRKNFNQLSLWGVIWIGLCQVLAVIPGVSRSGVTMTAARLIGLKRAEAARFSFLLSIPAIGGAATLGLYKYYTSTAPLVGEAVSTAAPIEWGGLLIGAGAACLTALISMKLLIKWLERVSFLPFVIYRVVLGAVLLFIGLT